MGIVAERVTRSENALREFMNARFVAVGTEIDGLERRFGLLQSKGD
jgi:hypothetical protein